MAQKELILTYEGLKKLENELEKLKTVRRREVAERIKTAREFGDLSENAEYDEAKNEQAFIEGRIAELEHKLKNAKVIDEDDIGTDIVSIGSTVKVKDDGLDEVFTYHIVSSAEADPMDDKISNESPVGAALISKKVGDKIIIDVPDGNVIMEIIEISK
ncbi:transcription elongation factor GreA [Alkalibacter saccharofermentans]|uniref:Transcription elongation factor GreA n=1 Tax=Alkalibacter saccharofermentans DSM 14828 TaxID=1120975 RepID=A0A1M4YG10_9FIRM|nr:transcription elongation factor GreA [Alkalibacter saccharofermentans]SHF04406.1 transcription elongation factor GreA [Alkalibacter saccharofermentans DSM 14828]